MLQTKIQNWRYRYEKDKGSNVWANVSLLNSEQANDCVSRAIKESQPFCVGKIGTNEQLLLLWGSQIPIELPLGIKWQVPFSETLACATNAGIKPRNVASYQKFSDLFIDDLSIVDLLGVFLLPREKSLWKKFAKQAKVCKPLYFTPFVTDRPWSRELRSKKVFVVSPFLDLFKQQMHKRSQIWQELDILPDFDIDGYQFPYLIDDNCDLDWQDVYQDAIQKMHRTDFEVALFGCGALGFPLAAEAKRLGKVGVHLGGFLQAMFGVAGVRHKEHPLFKKYINEAWISPPSSHKPNNYQQVEGGCYW
ncbi:hypothetical protein I4641_21795 [Waterburya agarophytonicola K14]|uniref:Uncharacterized protein n=1 Tax=Waterburya agarophytonicola KI4 TaxID=2874699 RepID=A0A964FLV1_9CYAN|nr:hypothetical protein [Waterburya agarophytonicola]MCC0179593.1 hypothetical protein [Waterburya agarophytonicola KI4]